MKVKVEAEREGRLFEIVFKKSWIHSKEIVMFHINSKVIINHKGFQESTSWDFFDCGSLDIKNGIINSDDGDESDEGEFFDVIREEWLKIKDKFASGRVSEQ